jgi:hypothetical protein
MPVRLDACFISHIYIWENKFMSGKSEVFIIFAAMVLLSLAVGTAVAAPVTQNINYQGKLTNAAGNPLTGTYSVTFSLYEVSSGGASLATDTHTVQASNGLFTTPITFNPKFFDGRALWLGVKVGIDPEMTPRQELRPVPYALSLRPGALINANGFENGIRVNKSDSGGEGIMAYIEGPSSNGFYSIMKGTGSNGFLTISYGSGSTGASLITHGANSPGVSSHTWGSGSHAFSATTEADGSNGLIVTTSGFGSKGVYVVTTGQQSAAIHAIAHGPQSNAIVGETSADGPAAVAGITTGKGSYGLYGKTSGGPNSDGVHALTTGPGSAGVYTSTTGTGSHGVYATTTGVGSHGYKAYTTGQAGDGFYGETTGPGSYGVLIKTQGTNSRGVYSETHGQTSDGVVSLVSGASSNGVTAYSTLGNGIYAEAGPAGGYAALLKGNVNILSKTSGASVMELGEGLDYSEGFDVSGKEAITPGTVLIISPDDPGTLAISSEPYDRKVAGIVAGANGLGSAVKVGGDQFDTSVALAGRVYCNVDATYGPIRPGDQLTTSQTPGYAMAVQDYSRAQGATIGKAMEGLEQGQKGQILVLVTLQ